MTNAGAVDKIDKVDSMRIDISAELKLPGKAGVFSADIPFEDMEYLGRMLRFDGPVHAEGAFVYDGKAVSVKGSLSTRFISECALCTKQFIEPFDASFDERFERSASPDDVCYAFSGDSIDLGQMLMDCILLNHASYSICKEDCRGLCPVCGCDLNQMQCGCAAGAGDDDDFDSPLSKLGALLNDDKEV